MVERVCFKIMFSAKWNFKNPVYLLIRKCLHVSWNWNLLCSKAAPPLPLSLAFSGSQNTVSPALLFAKWLFWEMHESEPYSEGKGNHKKATCGVKSGWEDVTFQSIYVGGVGCLRLICGHDESFPHGDYPPRTPVGCGAPNHEFRGGGLLSVSCPVTVALSMLFSGEPCTAFWKSSLFLSHFGTLTCCYSLCHALSLWP